MIKPIVFSFFLVLSCLAETIAESSKRTQQKEDIQTSSSSTWILSTNDYKRVKANGLPLKKAGYWEFPTLSQLETDNAEALIFLANRFYFKLFPESIVRWNGFSVQLVKGRLYIKSISSDLEFQVSGLFNFPLKSGDLIVEHNVISKQTGFDILSTAQAIHIDSDEREIPAPEGAHLMFTPEFNEGEMAYDFLLNDRKIPKMKIEKSDHKGITLMDLVHWKKPPKKFVGTNNNSNRSSKLNPGNQICKGPPGVLNSCIFVKEGDRCIRYTCNLNGLWALRTEFSKIQFCPSVKTIKTCEWLGQ